MSGGRWGGDKCDQGGEKGHPAWKKTANCRREQLMTTIVACGYDYEQFKHCWHSGLNGYILRAVLLLITQHVGGGTSMACWRCEE